MLDIRAEVTNALYWNLAVPPLQSDRRSGRWPRHAARDLGAGLREVIG